MKTIKVAAPAKINLTLEVLNKREDGFHNIKSVMQAISLYDYLTFTVADSDKNEIELSGNSLEIPYDKKNLVYKAIEKFLEKANINSKKISVFIEKNIPVEAGLAGGSTDAAATFFALNHLFSNLLSVEQIDELCSVLGSDLNFCLNGGTAICTGRGEKIQKIDTVSLPVSLVKPKSFGISAKEAYQKFAALPESKKQFFDYSDRISKLFDKKYLFNSLEYAVIDDYCELQEIKAKLHDSMMSGSGPTFFTLNNKLDCNFDLDKFLVIEGLSTVADGIKIIK